MKEGTLMLVLAVAGAMALVQLGSSLKGMVTAGETVARQAAPAPLAVRSAVNFRCGNWLPLVKW